MDAAGGLLGMELQPASRQHLHINALDWLNAEMGQQLLAQSHLALAGVLRSSITSAGGCQAKRVDIRKSTKLVITAQTTPMKVCL